MSDRLDLEYGKVWGRFSNDRDTMIQIGNNRFLEHGSFDRLIEEKREAARPIAEKLHIKSSDRVLEIGTGLGIHTSYFAERACFVYTVDVSEGFADYFARFCGERANIKRIVRPFFPMLPDILDGELDVAFSTAVFCHLHVYDIALYFEELGNKLKVGGRLYVNFQNSDNSDFSVFSRYLETYRSGGTATPIRPGQMQFHSREFFRSIGKEHGLIVSSEDTHGSYTEMVFERTPRSDAPRTTAPESRFEKEIVFSRTGNSTEFSLSGFSYPESWGTWTVEPAPQMIVPVPHPSALEMSMEFQAFARHGGPPAGFTAFVNGRAVGTFSRESGEWGQIYELKCSIPEDLTRAKSLVIEFRIENGPAPNELGANRRPIGIGLHRIRLQTTGTGDAPPDRTTRRQDEPLGEASAGSKPGTGSLAFRRGKNR